MAEEYINTSEYEKYFSEHLDDVHIAEVLNIMSEMPNADVMLVVRCKNCKYYEIGKEFTPYCKSHCNHIKGLNEPKDYDFCSYGERRE